MKRVLSLLFTISLLASAHAQNLFPVKLNSCNTALFCLDCGNIKGGADSIKFGALMESINTNIPTNGIQGKIDIQVLIDSAGNGCILSHTDKSELPFTLKLIDALNAFKGWTPAITDGKVESMTSVNMLFQIEAGKITAAFERVDQKAFMESFKKPKKKKKKSTND